MAKSFLLVCISAILAKSALSQCLGPLGRPYDLGPGAPLPVAYGGYSGYTGYSGCGVPDAGSLGASYGGGLIVTSTSPIAPTGLVVTSENVMEGVLSLGGNLPFLGAVNMEGVFPSVGAGSVSYSCGDGFIGIISEVPYANPYAAPAYAPSVAPLPYGPALSAPLPYGPAVAAPLPYGPAVHAPLSYGPAVSPFAPYGGFGYGIY